MKARGCPVKNNLWSYDDYSFCPDNLQPMSYLAAECPNVGLGTAVPAAPETRLRTGVMSSPPGSSDDAVSTSYTPLMLTTLG